MLNNPVNIFIDEKLTPMRANVCKILGQEKIKHHTKDGKIFITKENSEEWTVLDTTEDWIGWDRSDKVKMDLGLYPKFWWRRFGTGKDANLGKNKNSDMKNKTPTYSNITFFALNVCGLTSKLKYDVLPSYVSQFDVGCLSETKTENIPSIEFPLFDIYHETKIKSPWNFCLCKNKPVSFYF